MQKTNLRTLLFALGYIIYLISKLLSYTTLNISLELLQFFRIIALLIIIFKIVICDKVSNKYILAFLLTFVLALLINVNLGVLYLFELVIFIFGARKVNLKDIARIYFIISILVICIITILSINGLIEDYVYSDRFVGIRHSFGYIYPTDYAALVFYCLLSKLYLDLLDNKFRFYNKVLYMMAAYLLYRFCGAKLGALSIVMLVIASIYIKKKNNVNKFENFLLSYSVVIGAIISISIVILFVLFPNNHVLEAIDYFFTNRLFFSKMGLIRYGITLFGQKIVLHGAGGGLGMQSNYFFIDSSFFYILLMYGVVAFILIIIAFTKFLKNCIKKKQIIIPVLMMVVVVNSMVGQQMPQLEYNFFLLVFFANINDSVLLENISKR